MQTLTVTANANVLREVKNFINKFVKETGEAVKVKEELPTYISLEELREDYAQRIADVKSGKEKLTPLHEGLDEMMEEIKRELQYENQKITKIS